MFNFLRKPLSIPTADEALPGRTEPLPTADTHYVLGGALKGPYPEGAETALFGLGCFWGAERKFWELDGVYVDGGGLCRRTDAEPHLRGSVLRPHRAYRGRARGLRSEARQL